MLGAKETILSVSPFVSPSFSLWQLSKLRSGIGVGVGVDGAVRELDLCIAWPPLLGKVMPRGCEGGVPGLGLSRERKLSEGFGVRWERDDLGVPPREIEGFGVRSVVDVGVAFGVPGAWVDVAGIGPLFAASGVEVVSWVGVSLSTTRIVGPTDVAFAKGVHGNVSIGTSSPIAAANLICVDNGTTPFLTHGLTVNCLLGRSRPWYQLNTAKKARDRCKMVSRQDHLHLL